MRVVVESEELEELRAARRDLKELQRKVEELAQVMPGYLRTNHIPTWWFNDMVYEVRNTVYRQQRRFGMGRKP